MKILILSDGFWPIAGGGAERVAFDLARKFYQLDNQVYVITTVQDKLQAGQFTQDGLKIWRIYTSYHQRWRAYLSLFNPQVVSQVKKIIQAIGPEIVHIHNIHYYLSYYCLKIAKKHSQAVFLTAHDVMLFHYSKLVEFIDPDDLSIPQSFNYKINFWQQIKRFKKRYNPLRNVVIRYYLKYVDQIFAVSYSLKEALSQNNINNIKVIHNGINLAEWQRDEKGIKSFKKKHNIADKKTVFFSGKLNSWKGIDQLLEAVKKVTQQIPKTVLLVAGQKNDYSDRIIEATKAKNIDIILTGWLDKDELKLAYHCADLVVTPSLCLDTFNLVNLEAMSCQRPVISTCFGGASEVVVDNQTGYIVNPLDTDVMSEKIIDLLENNEKAEKFGKAGYNRAKEFSLLKQAEKYLNIFTDYN